MSLTVIYMMNQILEYQIIMKSRKRKKIQKMAMAFKMILEVKKDLSASKFIKPSMDLVRIWDLVANRTTRTSTLKSM